MKLSFKTLERITQSATAKEIDFLLYVMRFQDDMGVIKGITKSEVCEAINVHKSKFYSIISQLEAKGIIRVFWNEKRHGFWTIIVIDNSFVGKDSYKNGYINLNTKFLRSEEFLHLTKAEKVICLKVLSIYRENRKIIPLKLKTIMHWTGMSMQSVKKYVQSIKTVFNDISEDSDIITINAQACFDQFARADSSERDIYEGHLLNYILKAKKIHAENEELKDTLLIFKLLGKKLGINAIVSAILACLDAYGRLMPKYINKMTHIISKKEELLELFY